MSAPIQSMEQLSALKRTLNVPTIYEYYSPYWGKVGGFEIVTLSLLFSLVIMAITGQVSPLYLINGFLTPLFFKKHGHDLSTYWPCLASLLMLRLAQVTLSLTLADPFILIALWHPNINLSKELAKRFDSYFNHKSRSNQSP